MRTKTDQGLKARFEAAIAKAVAASGATSFSKSALVKQFANKGIHESTLYRWIEASIASGKPGQAAIRSVKKAAADRQRRKPDPAASMAAALSETLPAVVRPEDISGTPTIKIIHRLNQVIDAMDQLMTYARDEKGNVRNAKLLMAAADKLRSCLATAVKIQQAMRDIDQVDRLHDAILKEIGREAPEVKERILRRLAAMASQYGA